MAVREIRVVDSVSPARKENQFSNRNPLGENDVARAPNRALAVLLGSLLTFGAVSYARLARATDDSPRSGQIESPAKEKSPVDQINEMNMYEVVRLLRNGCAVKNLLEVIMVEDLAKDRLKGLVLENPDNVVPYLKGLLRDKDLELRYAALDTLHSVSEKMDLTKYDGVLENLSHLLGNKYDMVRWQVGHTLANMARMNPDKVIPHIKPFLKSRNLYKKHRTVVVFSYLSHELNLSKYNGVVKALLLCLRDKNPHIRTEAADALGSASKQMDEAGYAPVLKALERGLRDGNSAVLCTVASALERAAMTMDLSGRGSLLKKLRSLSKDADPDVARAALDALEACTKTNSEN
jgi:HEAT repeat protein